ncbi:MAG: single-stranded-DNA-specific exonuclease RecJ [Planctomycetes bacterium]|nr:single-stranded-DNA-specific exonuclease RecJ [Planctomycetota bacterium]
MEHGGVKVPEPDLRERALAKNLALPGLLCRVLLARGVDDPDKVRAFLRPDLKTLHDPFTFTAMPRAVERIKQALRLREIIVIHGDYDVDGISGSVLLYRFLRILHAEVKIHLPARSDGYSITPASEHAIAAAGAKLVISVDNGTNATASIARLQESGVDVIVTDHHGTSDHVAAAFAVLNPRLPDAGYPDTELAGVGVAFRLASAVAQSCTRGLLQSPEFSEFLVDAMTLVALGTVADVAPLRGENRTLVWHGLRALAQSRSPGIRSLLDSAGLSNRSPDVEDIGFRIAPLINAAGRMGHAQQAADLLCAPGIMEAQAAAKVLEHHNEDRRRVERKLQEAVQKLADSETAPAIVLGSEDWHAGVLGIVAARMAESTGKPTILVAFHDGVGRGSGRCPHGFHLRDALAACSEHLVAHGGHAAAAGLEVRRENFEAFRTRFFEVCRQAIPRGDGVPVDGMASFAELDPHTIRRLDLLAPFGMGHRRPRFCTHDVKIIGNPLIDTRGQGLKVRLTHQGTLLPARIIRAASRFEELRARQGPWTVIYTPRINPRGEEGPVQLDVHQLFAPDEPISN